MITDAQILSIPFFEGEEADIKLSTRKIVKVRKSHVCFLSQRTSQQHSIQVGERAYFEKALVDGDFWGRYYMCIPCCEKEYNELMGGDDNEEE